MSKNRFKDGDVIMLTQDCELGKDRETFHVVGTAGVYMTARSFGERRRFVRTGRDYAFATKIGTAPVDQDDAEAPTIPAGAYTIEVDVKNPSPDRRMTRDWTKAPVWTAGTEFVVREQVRMTKVHLEETVADLPKDVADSLRARNVYTVVEMAGDRHASLHRVGPGHVAQYMALAIALVPTEESVAQLMARVECDNRFVAWLVETDRVSRADLEKWWRLYMYDEDYNAAPSVNSDAETTLDEPAEE